MNWRRLQRASLHGFVLLKDAALQAPVIASNIGFFECYRFFVAAPSR